LIVNVAVKQMTVAYGELLAKMDNSTTKSVCWADYQPSCSVQCSLFSSVQFSSFQLNWQLRHCNYVLT